MGILAVIGIIYLIYKLVSEWAEPTQTGKFDWDKYNKDTCGKGYSSKQLDKMSRDGRWHTK